MPMANTTTRDAAQTVASVESQLRHLQLQHVEAQNRLQEFTLVAGELARRGAGSRSTRDASGTYVAFCLLFLIRYLYLAILNN